MDETKKIQQSRQLNSDYGLIACIERYPRKSESVFFSPDVCKPS